MAYGSQTWTMTKRYMDRLIRTQIAIQRRKLHIALKDRKCNTWIRARTRVTDARKRATRLKWQYPGHNARQVDNRRNAQMLNWRPWLGKRERGRSQMRWEHDIKRRAGLTWKRQVQNRDVRKEIGATYIRKWIEWFEKKRRRN